MQRLLILALLALIAGWSPVRAAAEMENAPLLEAAKRYSRIAPVAGIINDAVNDLSRQVPEEQREVFIKAMLAHIDVKRLEALLLGSLVNHFTIKELNTLADFYGSPEGRKILRKMGSLMSELQPEIQKEILGAIQKSKNTSQSE
ncbi:MAG: hypothetical protein A2511_00215 [Deltaproteobacteria bacterium RIFOXYD12_FULL_50_9]|nr:MAG: hypothetical protein A2511_00215 [Deltaproteobacteria bacterium RIFOXYD12_FULL_50_9]